MKIIIEGKKYDTETATLVASWDNGWDVDSAKYGKESLFRKQTGEYFICISGGSIWLKDSRSVLDSQAMSYGEYGGGIILPMSEPRARTWVEERANEKYEAIFGEVSE